MKNSDGRPRWHSKVQGRRKRPGQSGCCCFVPCSELWGNRNTAGSWLLSSPSPRSLGSPRGRASGQVCWEGMEESSHGSGG